MSLTIQKVQVWSGEVRDLLGAAAAKLDCLARAGANLGFVLARQHPTEPEKGVLYLAPITTREQVKAARAAGLGPALDMTMLCVRGLNRPDTGFRLMSALAIAGIPLQGLAVSAVGDHFTAHLAFTPGQDVTRAVQVLAKADV